MSCPSGKQYYVCAAGNFRGCCTLDPCTTGVCPDDDDDDDDDGAGDADDSAVTSSNAGPSTTAYGNPGSGSSSTSSTSPTISPAQSDSATSVAPDTITATTAASTPSSTSGSSGSGSGSGSESGSGSSSNSALIGGVVGGVLGALAILAIVLFLFCRRRKKQGKRFTLLRGSPRDDDEKGEQSLPKAGLAGETPRIKEPDHTRQHSSTTATTGKTFTSPGTQTLSTLGTSPDASAVDPNNNNATGAPSSFLPPIPPSSSLLPPPPAPGRTGLTPELPDTGFYRQRAELATDSQNELINVPPGQRRQHRPSPGPVPPKVIPADSKGAVPVAPGSSPRPNHNHNHNQQQQQQEVKRQTPPVVTTDGVVLRPNLDQGSRWRTGDGHVMSFMQYESGSESGKEKGEMKEGGNAPDVGLGLKGVVNVAGSDSCQKL